MIELPTAPDKSLGLTGPARNRAIGIRQHCPARPASRSARARTAVLCLVIALTGMMPFTAIAQDDTPDEDLGDVSGEIAIAGSSTVFPLTAVAAETFSDLAGDVEIAVEVSGTGLGFEFFCAGETDIQNASREIDAEELALCTENGITYYQFQVAFDGISIVVHPDNDFVDCLTTAQLTMLWQADDRATTWQDLDPAWPDETIVLFGPDEDSGTYDYFIDTILQGDEITPDYTPSADDFTLVEEVAQEPNGLAYFGYSYYAQNQDRLKLVGVDAGAGCQLPTVDTIQDLSYQPLARPLYVYVNAERLGDGPQLQEFIRYYLANAASLTQDVFIVPATNATYTEGLTKLAQAITGAIGPDGPPPSS